MDNSFFDVGAMFFFGVLGYIMRKFGFPLAPFLIAFVLGPMLENALRQALIIADGRVTIFLSRPISLGFIIVTVISIAFIVRNALKGKPAALSKSFDA